MQMVAKLTNDDTHAWKRIALQKPTFNQNVHQGIQKINTELKRIAMAEYTKVPTKLDNELGGGPHWGMGL